MTSQQQSTPCTHTVRTATSPSHCCVCGAAVPTVPSIPAKKHLKLFTKKPRPTIYQSDVDGDAYLIVIWQEDPGPSEVWCAEVFVNGGSLTTLQRLSRKQIITAAQGAVVDEKLHRRTERLTGGVR